MNPESQPCPISRNLLIDQGATKLKNHYYDVDAFVIQTTKNIKKLKLAHKCSTVPPILRAGLELHTIRVLDVSQNKILELESHVFCSLP